MSENAWGREARALLESRIAQFREYGFSQVERMPGASTEAQPVLGGKLSTLTVYVQPLSSDQLLLTVQCAYSVLGGVVGFHRERGLVFERNGAIREATSTELENSGG
jgi:hypothetical protein